MSSKKYPLTWYAHKVPPGEPKLLDFTLEGLPLTFRCAQDDGGAWGVYAFIESVKHPNRETYRLCQRLGGGPSLAKCLDVLIPILQTREQPFVSQLREHKESSPEFRLFEPLYNVSVQASGRGTGGHHCSPRIMTNDLSMYFGWEVSHGIALTDLRRLGVPEADIRAWWGAPDVATYVPSAVVQRLLDAARKLHEETAGPELPPNDGLCHTFLASGECLHELPCPIHDGPVKVTASVTRLAPHGLAGYLGAIEPESDHVETIHQRWGGGQYSVHMRANGKIVSRRDIEIAGEAKIPSMTSGTAGTSTWIPVGNHRGTIVAIDPGGPGFAIRTEHGTFSIPELREWSATRHSRFQQAKKESQPFSRKATKRNPKGRK